MEQSKVFELFCKFSGYERIHLRRFIHSPYHNQREDVCLLFDFLEKNTKKSKPDYDKKKAWAYCYGEHKPFKDNDMRSLMTFLLKTMERFLEVEMLLEKDPTQQFVYLAKAYQNLQLPTHTNQNLSQFEKYLTQHTQPNSYFLRAKYEYEQAHYTHTETLKRNTQRSLQSLTDSLETQFIAERLRQACELLAHQTVYKIEYDKGMLDFLLGYVAQKKEIFLNQPAISLYYYYYQASTQTSEASADFFELYTQQLLAIQTNFPMDELRNLYKMAINYTIRKTNTDSSQFYTNRMFVFYEAGLSQSILLENKQLSRFTYKNMVSLALLLGKHAWALDFIRQYTPLLPANFQPIYEPYALGKYHFATKNLPLALEYLHKVTHEDIFLSLDIRSTQLKIYYELGDYDTLDYYWQSFKMFLSRQKKVLGYHYPIYKQILHLTNQLTKSLNFSKTNISQLSKKIKTIPTLTEREWLLKMLEGKK